ncbi:glucan endo-1,3-beta-glucosidase-like [Quillaja saponaria]|uniref:Glucan endo-1,3-beta-glucosidase-like n=1 Tax=Quillaja saponaria TaxID=32244 RepID=A0AAD7M553_QUISA|nr:glucan endo-1,3-beta-glucosidase-like [Quillaja saponaria]
MAKSVSSLSILFLILLLLSVNLGGTLKFTNGWESQNTWCVAKPSTIDAELSSNIEYACNQLRDCYLIQEGGSCYNPNTLINHASVVMNLYYQSNGRNNWNCDFRGSGLIVGTDPSYGACKYAF